MKKFLQHRYFYTVVAIFTIIFIVSMMLKISKNDNEKIVTAVVEEGTVQQLVSVSGVAEADQSADLAFTITGVVEEIFVAKGQT